MSYDTRTLAEKITDRNAKIDALQQRLTSAVESLVTGDDWRRAIEFAAQFRSRSFNNTLLIWLQHSIAHAEGRVPDPFPTYLAGFQQWRQLGRAVMKGQSGYQIIAPVTARMASDEPDDPGSWHRLGRGEKPSPGQTVRPRLIGVKPAYVWDISMTNGPPVAQLPRPQLLTGQAPDGMWDGLARIVNEQGFTLHDAPDAAALHGANGMTSWATHTVHVRADMDDASRARTLAHETGHIVLHSRDNADAATHRGIAEVEAESVALMIGAAHGMDTTPYTIPYVSTWASRVPEQDPIKTIQDTASRVRAAAIGILDRLDTAKTPDGTPPGLDRALDRPIHEQPDVSASRPPLRHNPSRDGAAIDQSADLRGQESGQGGFPDQDAGTEAVHHGGRASISFVPAPNDPGRPAHNDRHTPQLRVRPEPAAEPPTPGDEATRRPERPPASAEASGPYIQHGHHGTTVLGTDKSDTELRNALKEAGFKWSSRQQLWYLPHAYRETTRSQKVRPLQHSLHGGGRRDLPVTAPANDVPTAAPTQDDSAGLPPHDTPAGRTGPSRTSPPSKQWRPHLAAAGPGILDDPHWPTLAAQLDRLADAGADVPALIAAAQAGIDRPSTSPALDLDYAVANLVYRPPDAPRGADPETTTFRSPAPPLGHAFQPRPAPPR